MKTLIRIINEDAKLSKPKKKFWSDCFPAIQTFIGKGNFRNISRYGFIHEKSISRHYSKDEIDFGSIHKELIDTNIPADKEMVLVGDATFLSKAGKKTDNLGHFFDGSNNIAKRGLEAFVIAAVEVQTKTAMSISAKQTLNKARLGEVLGKDATRIDLYKKYIEQAKKNFPPRAKYFIVDGGLASKAITDAVLESERNLIGKMRIDANLHYTATPPKKRKPGRPRLYGEKFDHKDIDKLECIPTDKKNTFLYHGIFYSRSLKRNIKVVWVVNKVNGKIKTVTPLFSTDLNLSAKKFMNFMVFDLQLNTFLEMASNLWVLKIVSLPKNNLLTLISMQP